jgi:hypothetical protein
VWWSLTGCAVGHDRCRRRRGPVDTPAATVCVGEGAAGKSGLVVQGVNAGVTGANALNVADDVIEQVRCPPVDVAC